MGAMRWAQTANYGVLLVSLLLPSAGFGKSGQECVPCDSTSAALSYHVACAGVTCTCTLHAVFVFVFVC